MSTPKAVVETVNLWSTASQNFSVWRNSGLECFAQAEVAVTHTLVSLAADPVRGTGVKLRHLFGQRLQDLETAIGPSGAFELLGKIPLQALLAFQSEANLRPFLAHSVAKIAVDRDGEWIAIMTHSSFKSKQLEKHKLMIEKTEALSRLKALQAKTQSLCAHLRNLTSKLQP
jgi:hypothetical protein